MITMFGLSLWLKLNNNFYQIQPEKGATGLQHLFILERAYLQMHLEHSPVTSLLIVESSIVESRQNIFYS